MSKETEKIFSQMHKYMEQFDFDNEEQMEKEMKNFIQKLNNNEIEFDDDPKFQSDDLLEEAYNTPSKTKAIKLAKQALEINPENIDAECFIADFEENQIKILKNDIAMIGNSEDIEYYAPGSKEEASIIVADLLYLLSSVPSFIIFMQIELK